MLLPESVVYMHKIDGDPFRHEAPKDCYRWKKREYTMPKKQTNLKVSNPYITAGYTMDVGFLNTIR